MEVVPRRRAIRETNEITDVSPLLRNCKNQKLNDEQNTDRISNLPDAILLHILTSLLTKDAVKTSILSKRWQYLWMSITDLMFEEEGPNKSENRVLFMNFVERVLVLRDSSDLTQFGLLCDVLHDASRINAWISAAVRHKVQKLFLILCNFEEPFVLPHCLFTCESLTHLVLELCVLLKVPSSIQFSNLKVLNFKFVLFPDDRSMQRLFSSFPVLEKLTFDSCSFWNVRSVCISSPLLRTLTILEGLEDPDQDNCQFLILGSSLKYFTYVGEFRNEYFLYNTSSLIKAVIDLCGKESIESGKRQREVSYRVYKLLRGLSIVKELLICAHIIEVLTYSEELLAHLPVFCNLTCLLFEGWPIDFAYGALGNVIQKLSCVNSLKFEAGICLSTYSEESEWRLDPVPPCFSTHLKTINIRKFSGTKGELHVVKFLLENALILERMDISCSLEKFSGGSGRQMEVRDQLLILPRRSKKCAINFS